MFGSQNLCLYAFENRCYTLTSLWLKNFYNHFCTSLTLAADMLVYHQSVYEQMSQIPKIQFKLDLGYYSLFKVRTPHFQNKRQIASEDFHFLPITFVQIC